MEAREPSGALMLVHPGMSEEEIENGVSRGGFLGLKPYRFFSATGDAVHCRITDFLPEHQIAVADRHELLIMMHLSRPEGIADPVNLDDLENLTAKYPNARWDLAHCARAYSAWPIERAGGRLRDLPNTWFDTSSVCESDAIDALIECVGIDRVMYGSDDVPVGVLRGKYVAFGHAWALSVRDESQSQPGTLRRADDLHPLRTAPGDETCRDTAGTGKSGDRKAFSRNAFGLVESVRRYSE